VDPTNYLPDGKGRVPPTYYVIVKPETAGAGALTPTTARGAYVGWLPSAASSGLHPWWGTGEGRCVPWSGRLRPL